VQQCLLWHMNCMLYELHKWQMLLHRLWVSDYPRMSAACVLPFIRKDMITATSRWKQHRDVFSCVTHQLLTLALESVQKCLRPCNRN
jgi:hypothetical protein